MGGKINKASKAYIRRSSEARDALAEVTKNLEAAISAIGDVTAEALDEIALTIMNKSNTYAPLDTGKLIESSYTSSQKSKNNYTVEIGYKAPYSIYTHEIGPYKNPTTPGTTYKYLQRAASEIESDIPEIVADAARNITK